MIPLGVKCVKDRVLSYDLNLKAIVAGYMIGTGGFDMSRVIMMMGIDGGYSFERQFYRSGSYVYEVVMKVCDEVVGEALREEMVVTMEENLKDKLDSATIENLKDKITQNDLQSINNDIASVALDVAYDMGWQKRAGGRVYDSLSGHDFLIGQKNGKCIS